MNIMLSDGSAVHLSTRSYLTPKRTDLTETGGLTPHVEVSLTEEEWNRFISGELSRDDDPQLREAVKAIKLSGGR